MSNTLKTQNKLTKTKIGLCALLTSILLYPTLAAASFYDVQSSDPHFNAIHALETNGVMKGYNDGSFRPNQLITRAELLKAIFNDIGYKAKEDQPTQTKYKDVPASSWFSPYVKKAYDLGLTSINPDLPFFYPAAPISTVETLKILMSAEGIPIPPLPSDQPTGFTDIQPSSPYSYIARAALAAGLFPENTNSRFNALKMVTRGEAAEFIYKARKYREAQIQNILIINPDNINNNYLTEIESDFMDNAKFPIMLDVWNKINTESLNKDKINRDDLLYGAIDGMVKTVNDPYTIFEKPANAQTIKDDLQGTIEGIGTMLDTFEDSIIITNIFKDSPAEKAGLKIGDIITSVDGKTIIGMPIEDVLTKIKGPAGTSVKLTVNRNGSILTFTITRAKLNLDTVIPIPGYTNKLPDDIGYISIYQFTDSTAAEFDKIFAETMAKKPKGLILDLRDNPGGYLDSAYNILGHFIKTGKTIINLKINGKNQTKASDGKGEFQDAKIPLIVLVNEGTASAAEVVAGALQDYKVGKLLGETTYGKGTVQEATTYTDGSFFKLTIAHWMTPLQRNIDQVGLTPDITVKTSKSDFLGQTDSQLDQALKELSQ